MFRMSSFVRLIRSLKIANFLVKGRMAWCTRCKTRRQDRISSLKGITSVLDGLPFSVRLLGKAKFSNQLCGQMDGMTNA